MVLTGAAHRRLAVRPDGQGSTRGVGLALAAAQNDQATRVLRAVPLVLLSYSFVRDGANQ
jgi:hypothetical protein